MRILAILLFSASLAYAADPFTGEPIPAQIGDAIPRDEVVAPNSRDTITLVAHIADGATKEVRALGNGYVVFENGAWLEFYDMSDPFEPVPRARILVEAIPSDMTVVGNLLYVALRKTEGLLVVDVSNPAAPVVVGQREGYDLLSVAVGNGYAYCGRGTTGVVILNLSDLTTAGTFTTTGSANGTAVVGNTVYVARGANGLGIYDVTNPAAVTTLGTYATGGFCTYVVVRDNLAYLAGAFGLVIVDVTNPALPVFRGSFPLTDSTFELVLAGNDLYLAGTGAYRLDVSNPALPVELAQFSPASSLSIAVQGTSAFLADRFVGLRVLTADAMEAMFLVQNAGFSNRLHLDGSLLHVVDLGGGVRIWDISDPAHPVSLSDTATPANSQDLAVANGVSYVVSSNTTGDGLWTLDVSVPQQPVVLDMFNTGGNPYGIEVQGTRAYVANGNGGLQVVNVTDPAAPVAMGSLPFASQAFDVRAQGNVAYVALFGAGLASVNVTSPAFMAVIDQESGWGFLNALDVTGTTAWVAAQTGLRVVDISNPANLTSVSFTSLGGQPRDVKHFGDVYLADDFYGLRQIDVTNPALPVIRASFPSADRGMGVDADGNLVALAAGEGGVYLFQVDNGATAVDVNPASSVRLDAAPNPFNPQLQIRWDLPAPASLRVAIHDARGRLVRDLDLGPRPAGAGSVTWNGTDDSGRACASGTYLLRLHAGAETVSRTVTLVR